MNFIITHSLRQVLPEQKYNFLDKSDELLISIVTKKFNLI